MTQILIVFALATICGGGALITVASVLQLIEFLIGRRYRRSPLE